MGPTIVQFGKSKVLSALLLLLLVACDSGSPPVRITQLQEAVSFEAALHESSGLALRGEFLWTINDSGNTAEIHRLNRQGELLASIEVKNAENRDWEAMAQDEDYVYLADTGNNLNRRDEFFIYRIAWDSLDEAGDSVAAEVIEFSYGDREPGSPRSHNFDSEALAVRGDELWLFTKNRGDGRSNLYRLPTQPGRYKPMPSQSLAVGSLVTGADIHPESGELVLVSTMRRLGGSQKYLWIAPTSEEGVVWEGMRSLRFRPVDQWEAVAWKSGGEKLYLTHEGNARHSAGLATLDKPSFDVQQNGQR